jgi:hypothetical protein
VAPLTFIDSGFGHNKQENVKIKKMPEKSSTIKLEMNLSFDPTKISFPMLAAKRRYGVINRKYFENG